MTYRNDIDELFAALDPLTKERAERNESQRDAIWTKVENRIVPARRAKRRLYVGGASLTSLAAVSLVIAGILPGTPALSAAAAELTTAAHADAHAASLPPLTKGQFYYQNSAISLVCQFSSPSMPAGQAVTYISDGAMQSWTNAQGQGQVTITPFAVNENGSHFASSQDQAEWIAAGRPYVPCALGGSSNQLNGNAANVNTTSPNGGYVSSGTGYSGFGVNLASNSVTTDLSSGTNVNNLPVDVTQIASMLANGEINLDGSVSTTPQTCPANNPQGSGIGCSTGQQLAVIEQLMQLPDASAKLGSVLYQVMAQMPGASLAGNVTDSLGASGNAVTVPTGQGQEFEVILNPTTGELLSCSELQATSPSSALYTPSSQPYESIGQVTYGPISVVQGIGSTAGAS